MVSIYHHINITLVEPSSAETVPQAPRFRHEIGFALRPVPLEILTPESAPANHPPGFAKPNHSLEKPKNLPVLLQATPIKPGRFVVLIVRIIVAMLCVEKFIPSAKHR